MDTPPISFRAFLNNEGWTKPLTKPQEEFVKATDKFFGHFATPPSLETTKEFAASYDEPDAPPYGARTKLALHLRAYRFSGKNSKPAVAVGTILVS